MKRLLKAIQPQIDRLVEAQRKLAVAAEDKRLKAASAAEEKERKEAAVVAAAAGVRGPEPEFIGDCCMECLFWFKRRAKDPSSVSCERSTGPRMEGAYWTTTQSFRAKNGFGAFDLWQKKFFIQQNQVVDVK